MKTHGVLAWKPWPDGSGSRFAVKAAPYVMVRVKRLLPRANPYQKGWVVVSDTPEVARDLEWLVGRYPLEMDEQTAARLAGRAEEHRRGEAEVERILAGRAPARDGLATPARAPRDYQLVAADLAAATGRLLLLDALGLGKSMSSLLVLRDEDLLPAVVVCYPHLERQWAGEVAECFPDLLVHAVKTMQPYDPALHRGDGRRPDVLIVPWSKLRGWGHHLRDQARTVVFDEAQELRTGPTSQKYRAAAELAEQAVCSLELTATPVYNYGGEIFNLVAAIAPDVLGSREEFMREWCGSDDGAGRRALVRDPAGLGEYLRDQGVMLRRSRREVGRELPATERIPHVVAFDENVMSSGDDEVVQLADVVLARQAPKGERFLAAGELDWRLRRLTGLAKAPYVAAFVDALLEQEDDKIVLYGWHRDVYDQWRRRLAPHQPVFYTGSESKAEKQRSFDAFVRGDSRVLIVSLRAGAGLDGLQGASHTCVFGELDWSPGVHEQCLDAETEILTARGYLGPDDLRDDDLVACWDEADGSVRWSSVVGRVDRPLGEGEEMVELRLPAVDLRVTAGHRMVWRHPGGGRKYPRPGAWRMESAQYLVERRSGWHLPVSGIQDAVGVPLTDPEIAFVGWVLTDGYVNHKARQVTIDQDERSPENASIVAALDGANLAWSSSIIERRTPWSECSRLIRYFVPKFGSRTRAGGGWGRLEPWLDKDICSGWEDATANQLAVLLRAMNDGDGAKMRGRDYTPATWVIGTSRSLAAERLTSLAQRRGWRVSLAQITTAAGRPHWHIHLRPGAYRHVGGHGRPGMRPSVSTPGERVWCVTTETGTLLVRRHGKTAVVGNCIGRLERDGMGEHVTAFFLVAEAGSDPVVMDVLGLKRAQSEPLVDPDAAPFAPVAHDDARVVRLAEYVRARRGR